jgi:hypothetical protein
MRNCTFGAIAVALALGVPVTTGFFTVIAGLSTAAQADIACGRMGCRETGRTIKRNGSYYRGLGFGSQTPSNQPKADSSKQQSR